MKLLYREFQKYTYLVVVYFLFFFITLALLPFWLEMLGYFDFGSVMKGYVNNTHELIWWILVMLFPAVAIASYWSKESSVFFPLEFTRIHSLKKWLLIKLAFIFSVLFFSFLIMGGFVYMTQGHLNSKVILMAMQIDTYVWMNTSLLLLLSLFISSISIVLIILLITHISFVYFTVNLENQLIIGWNGSPYPVLILLVINLILIYILITLSKPAHLIQKRRERN